MGNVIHRVMALVTFVSYVIYCDFLLLFFADTQNPFIKLHTNVPEMIRTTNGEELIIPCRVTAPDIHVKLKMVYFFFKLLAVCIAHYLFN